MMQSLLKHHLYISPSPSPSLSQATSEYSSGICQCRWQAVAEIQAGKEEELERSGGCDEAQGDVERHRWRAIDSAVGAAAGAF